MISLDSHLGLVHTLGSTDLSVDWRSWHGLVGNLGHPNRKTKRQTWQMCALLTPKIGSGESTGEVMQEAWCRVYEPIFGKEKRGNLHLSCPCLCPKPGRSEAGKWLSSVSPSLSPSRILPFLCLLLPLSLCLPLSNLSLRIHTHTHTHTHTHPIRKSQTDLSKHKYTRGFPTIMIISTLTC